MEFTGERFVPGECDRLLEAEHRERYLFAAPYARGKKVLDIACGTGYGTRILHDSGAESATGVDVSAEAVAFAQEHFGAPGITFLAGDAQRFEGGSYDLVVSFETLEHLDHRDLFLRNLCKLTADGGTLIISTPNKAITSPLRPSHKIRNVHHKYEYLEKEFVAELEAAGFQVTGRYGQHPYHPIYNIQVFSRLFRRWRKLVPETAGVLPLSGNTAKYFVFVARKKA